MKFRGVQRAVRPQRFERSAGDAPNLGRVARVPGTGLPKGERRKRRRGAGRRGNRERRKRKMVILAWSLVLVFLAAGMLGTAVWFWLQETMHRSESEGKPAEEVVETRKASRFESPSEKAALDLVKRALSLREPAKVAECFHPGSAGPEKVVDFLRNMEREDGPVQELTWLSSMDANGLLIDGVLVKTNPGNQLRNRLALLTPDEVGVWKIDFGAFARTVEPSWNELLEKNAAEGLVRVIVAKDNYYNGVFSDESQWVCYGMASPDTEEIMLGYCRKGSPQAAAMEKIVAVADPLTEKQAPKRATLKIRRNEGGKTRQFEITRVMAEDWVVSAKPFDGNFQ